MCIAWLVGYRHRPFPWKTVTIATALQLALAGLLLRSGIRSMLFTAIGEITRILQETALEGNRSLLFSGLNHPDFIAAYGPIIALDIAAILIFVSSLSRILYHYRILPWVITRLSRPMQAMLGISAAESVATTANIFLGMTEAPLLVRPYIARMTDSELFCLMTTGLATIAGTVMVLYAAMLQSAYPEIAGHLFTASLISVPAAIAVSKTMLGETIPRVSNNQSISITADDTANGIDAATRGAAEGIHLVLNIIAMLIAFIGLVALINVGIGIVDQTVNGVNAGSWSLQRLAGLLFRPLIWLMGIGWEETRLLGELMGTKTIINEFVAYHMLSGMMQSATPLPERSFLIMTYAMCGFANFGSVAIVIGGIGGIAPERRQDLARLGLRALLGGTIATMLTGAVAGFYI